LKGCTGLTSRGRAQVGALAARLGRTKELAGTDVLYASVLPRALETAQILAPVLSSDTTLPVVSDCALCELHPGEGDGLTWAEFVDRFGEPSWDEDPDTPLAPGGESWSSFLARAGDGVEAVVAAHPGRQVVVVCHAGVVEAALARLLPVRPGARRWLRTEHASMTELELAPGAAPVLVRYNDVTPLQQA
jgi:probable phosphoglycerate mutase